MAPAFADIGKATKDLLAGNPKSGAYCFDPKLAFTSKTVSGVSFAVSAVKKADNIDPSLKVAYATKTYSANVSLDASSKVGVSGTLSGLAPGLKLTSSVTLPNMSSAKIAVDYTMCHFATLRAAVGLTAAPVVDLTLATGAEGFTVGGECAYDTSKSALTKYNIGVGYAAPDFQVAAFLADKATTAKISYAHNVTSTSIVGAEIVRKLATSDTTFTIGYSKKLSSGALAKLKIDTAGVLSALYETKLTSGEKVAGSLQVQATDLSKPVKYGFALDLF